MLPDKYRFPAGKFSSYLVQFKGTAPPKMVAATSARYLTYLHLKCEFREIFFISTKSTWKMRKEGAELKTSHAHKYQPTSRYPFFSPHQLLSNYFMNAAASIMKKKTANNSQQQIIVMIVSAKHNKFSDSWDDRVNGVGSNFLRNNSSEQWNTEDEGVLE